MPLEVPDDWRVDLQEQRTQVAEALFGRIVLSHYPSLSIPPQSLAADLNSGAVLTGRTSGHRFTLIGRRYTVELIGRPGTGKQESVAVISQARETDSMLPKFGWFRAQFDIRPIFEEAYCDLPHIWSVIGANGPARRSQTRPADARPYRQLLARRYGALGELLELLRTRTENTIITASCRVREVLPGRPRSLLLQIRGRAADFEDSTVTAESDGLRWESKVTEVHGSLAVIEAPPGADLAEPALTELTLSKTPRFTMGQHVLALRELSNGDTRGDWAHLAAIMTQTGDLGRAQSPDLDHFFSDHEGLELNPEQRDAVQSAVSTPHLFCIQGPPGTGKTAVICEIVRQLVHRGERVLLLAPSHVALDEALRRVGDKPGIRALRLSWSDSKVDEDLRRFLPDRLATQLSFEVRRPAGSRSSAWMDESVRAEQLLAAINQLATGHDRLQELETELGRAEAALLAEDDYQHNLAREQTAEVARLRGLLGEVEADADGADAECELLSEHIAAAREELKGFGPALGRLRGTVHSISAVTIRIKQATANRAAAAPLDVELSNRLAPIVGRIAILRDRMAEAEAGMARDRYWAETFHARLDQIRPRTVWQSLREAVAEPKPAVAELKRQLKGAERSWSTWRTTLSQIHSELAHLERERDRRLPEQQKAERIVRDIDAFIETENGHLDRLNERFREQLTDLGVSPGQRAPQVSAVPTVSDLRDSRTLPYWLFESRPAAVLRSIEAAERRLADLTDISGRRQELFTRLSEAEASLERQRERRRARTGQFAARADLRRAAVADQRAVMEESTTLLKTKAPEGVDSPDLLAEELRHRQLLLPHLHRLERRWFELTANLSDKQLAQGIDLAYNRSANLVCATTAGIAGRGSAVVRFADFDTMILDEASRVTDTEFLIGAIRARKWVLVGDEKQLPPHVDNDDERFMHALVALDRWERGQAATLEAAVRHLAAAWQEEEEIRRVRVDDVLAYASELHSSGQWETLYRSGFKSARRAAKNTLGGLTDEDPDRLVLRNIHDFFVRSLFERLVTHYRAHSQALVTQRRMIDPIARLVRKPVYSGAYSSPPAQELAARGITPLTTARFTSPVVFLDTSAHGEASLSEQIDTGFVNRLEAKWIVLACQEYESHLRRVDPKGPRTTVSVLCFYKAQADLIWKELGGPGYGRFRRLEIKLISSIDRSQGQESDLVLVSFTRASASSGPGFALWLQDLRRLNVACTRARRALVLVGHRRSLDGLGATGARAFYTNLFDLLNMADADYQLIKDLS